MTALRLLQFVSLVFALTACSSDPSGGTGNGGGDADGGADVADDATSDAPTDPGDGGGDLGEDAVSDSAGDTGADSPGVGVECEAAWECAPGLICDPGSGLCTDDTSCEGHADCGVGAYCATDDGCVLSEEGSPCASSDNCIPGEFCLADACVPAGCEVETFTATRVPPNMLIALDRSNSMHDEIGNPQREKWDIARDAINSLVAARDGEIRFALSLFPGLDQGCDEGEDCGAGVVNLDITAVTGSAIEDYLEDAGTCQFGTPIAEELEGLVDYEGLEDANRQNYVLLVTDGMASCEDPVPAVTELRDEDPTILTFVVGFGGGVDEEELEAMAIAGGTARTEEGEPLYYQADDEASLQTALQEIGGNIVSCTYVLSEDPPNPEELYVYFDGEEVPRDATDTEGWNYSGGTQRIGFFGEACEALRDESVEELLIVYGCALGPKD